MDRHSRLKLPLLLAVLKSFVISRKTVWQEQKRDIDAEFSVGYYEWKRSDDGDILKALVTISAEEAIDMFNSQLVTFKQYIYIKRKQVSLQINTYFYM